MPKILDACCGSRMFWFDKENPDVTFMDCRQYYEELPTGHVINVNPDVVADFRDMPFEDNEFDLVVFDPPHLIHAGENSWLAKKYGKLDGNRSISEGDQGGLNNENYRSRQKYRKNNGTYKRISLIRKLHSCS